MAITNNTVAVLWSTASSKSVTAGATEISDNEDVTAADCPKVTLTLKADNAGTPASGDTVDFYVSKSADGGTTYDTVENYEFLCQIDTYTPSADPSSKTVEFSIVGVTDWKLVAISNASSNSITVSANGKELDLE